MPSRPQSQCDPNTERDEDAVGRYIENHALVLSQVGLPRMPARVFAALTAADSGHMTAAELADRLSVSPAAVSGAVRYLMQVGMVAKEREPGARRDHYRIYDDLWYASYLKRERAMTTWRDATLEGVHALGSDTPAGQRLARMADFLDFIAKEIPALFDRWHEEERVAQWRTD